jgi:hypothetical protein
VIILKVTLLITTIYYIGIFLFLKKGEVLDLLIVDEGVHEDSLLDDLLVLGLLVDELPKVVVRDHHGIRVSRHVQYIPEHIQKGRGLC